MGRSRTHQVAGGMDGALWNPPSGWGHRSQLGRGLAHGTEEGSYILKERGSMNPVLWFDPCELILCSQLQSLKLDSVKDLSN